MTHSYVSSALIGSETAPEAGFAQPQARNDLGHLQKTITEIFEQQVRLTPNAVAVVFEGTKLTYQELNERANQLAHYLHDLGTREGSRVGICVERSLEMVVGILGILKAGAAYVPLDRNYPQERLSFMVRDAEVEVLLSQDKLVERIPSVGAKAVFLDSDWAGISRQPNENPASTTTADHPAYIIYTSGSTGRPKGVWICHRNAVRLVQNSNYADLGPDQVFLQFVSISFDVAAFEIWGALLNGARLIIFPAYTPSAEELGLWVSQHPVTTLWLTSGLFHQMVEIDTGDYFRGLRQLLAGGDVLSLRLVQKFLKQYPRCRLINGYGPTENGTFSTCGELRQMPADATSVTIGVPIANSTAYVLGREMNPLGPPEVGELYLGGHGVAHGYWKQPSLTAEKFLPDPFSSTPGARLYRTGDLARYLADGTLEFLGRIDQQVKLRGYRIELGEIEAILEQHPGVGQAVALVREDSPGDKRLTAYVVEAAGNSLDTGELREYVSKKLPEYMVPSAFVLMKQLPLTANGKVDRRALPMPAGDRLAMAKPYIAPRTATEKLLSSIWAEVLHIDRVGVEDDFFDLGGNSLLAAQVISRVGKACEVALPLRSFFERPVLTDLAQSVEAARRGASGAHVPSLGALQRGQEIPLGFSQERVWFLQQLDPSSIAYHFQATLEINGPLHVPALERSLTEMVKRHEILRTTFTERDGRPVQVVHEPVPAALSIVQLRDSEREKLREATEKIIQDEVAKHFDVNRLPLIRWVLLSFSEAEHLLLHIEHHFVHDGWSFNVFLGELLELYKAFAAGQPSPLPPPRFQFADFAIWQHEHLRSAEVQVQLDYWLEKLAGSPTISELPTDHPRSKVQTFHGGLLRIPLDLELCEKLYLFGVQEDASLFVIMMSAFFALAYQYTRQPEFCVGTSLANRQRSETEGLLGMLVNNVVLRAQMPANASFRDLLSHVRDLTFEAYDNQDVPFQEVVKGLNANRDLSVNPLFQTTFNFHNSPISVPEIPELKLKLQEALGNGAAKFDLGVIVIPASAQRLRLNPEWERHALTMLWEYSTDLFEETTVRRMIAHYQQILRSMMANPQQSIGAVSLLTEKDWQTLVDWNKTHKDAPAEKCVHELFTLQAHQTPELPALAYRTHTVRYGELNQRANQLARYLRRQGVHPEVRVGICMERCPEMVVAMLGILKAGGSYVPLDLNYPAARLQYLVEDAELKLLLTKQSVLKRLSGIASHCICVDQLWNEIGKEDDHDFESGACAENLAYVIYTSGSTGVPKGVAVPHRGLVNLAAWHRQAYQVTPADRATQVAAQAFDASVWELWPYLLSGSCIDLPDTEDVETPTRLLEWLAKREISICFLPTPLAEVLSHLPLPSKLKLRELLTGGDKLHQGRWSDFPFTITNHYGPTENTVVTTCARATSGNVPPIGKPINNVRTYVLDENFQPVAIGIAGELHVSGRGLARHYLNRPDLTAEKFVPDPFSGLSGERLYKTGDIVRYLPNGNLEFIGRKDQQIKLRGYRIELGEIEATLLEHPDVKQAVSALREESGGEKRLVAYFVSRQKTLTGDALRAFLQQRLPGYMVPTSYVELEELPLTSNGKVNRQALPAPKRESESHRPPRNAQESLLCGIFAEVLSLEEVSIDDDFFALGGHSLMATRVVSQIRKSLGSDLSVRAIFDAPTVALLSDYLARDRHPPLHAVEYANPATVRRAKDASSNA